MVDEVWFSIEDIYLYVVVSLSVLQGFIRDHVLYEDRIIRDISFGRVVVDYKKIKDTLEHRQID